LIFRKALQGNGLGLCTTKLASIFHARARLVRTSGGTVAHRWGGNRYARRDRVLLRGTPQPDARYAPDGVISSILEDTPRVKSPYRAQGFALAVAKTC